MNFIKTVFVITSTIFCVVVFFALFFQFKEHGNIAPLLVFTITLSCGYLWGWDSRENRFDKDLKKELDNFDKIRSSK